MPPESAFDWFGRLTYAWLGATRGKRSAKREATRGKRSAKASRYGKLSGAEDLHDLGANLDDVDTSLQLRDAAALHVVVFRLGVVEQIDKGSGIYLTGALIHADGELGGPTLLRNIGLDIGAVSSYLHALGSRLVVADQAELVFGDEIAVVLEFDGRKRTDQTRTTRCILFTTLSILFTTRCILLTILPRLGFCHGLRLLVGRSRTAHDAEAGLFRVFLANDDRLACLYHAFLHAHELDTLRSYRFQGIEVAGVGLRTGKDGIGQTERCPFRLLPGARRKRRSRRSLRRACMPCCHPKAVRRW